MPRMQVINARFLVTPLHGGVEYPAGYGGKAPEWVVAALVASGDAVRMPDPEPDSAAPEPAAAEPAVVELAPPRATSRKSA